MYSFLLDSQYHFKEYFVQMITRFVATPKEKLLYDVLKKTLSIVIPQFQNPDLLIFKNL